MTRRALTALALVVALAAAAIPGGGATRSSSVVLTLKVGGSQTPADLTRALATVRERIAALGVQASIARSGADEILVRIAASEPARVVAAYLTHPAGIAMYDLTPSLLPVSIGASRNPAPATSLTGLIRRAQADHLALPPRSDLVTCSARVAQACPGVLSRPAAGVTYYYLLQASPQIATPDVETGKAIADVDPTTGGPLVDLQLTHRGDVLFRAVSRAVARRGRSLRVLQSFAIVVDCELISFPTIDYLAYPNGIDPTGGGIQISGLATVNEARNLAATLRAAPPPRPTLVAITHR